MNRRRGRRHRRSFHKKHKNSTLYGLKNFVRKNPLISAVGSILFSIILVRVFFSNTFFGNEVSEFRLWFLFFAIVLGIIGLVALRVWFKNNVSNFNVQTNLNWRRH